jgi:hypothetical protein
MIEMIPEPYRMLLAFALAFLASFLIDRRPERRWQSLGLICAGILIGGLLHAHHIDEIEAANPRPCIRVAVTTPDGMATTVCAP